MRTHHHLYDTTKKHISPLWNGKPIPAKLRSTIGALEVTVDTTGRNRNTVDVAFTVTNTSKKRIRNVTIRLEGIGVLTSQLVRIASMNPGETLTGKLSTKMTSGCNNACKKWNRNRPIHLSISYRDSSENSVHKGIAPAGYADYYGWKMHYKEGHLPFVYAPDKTADRIAALILNNIKSRRINIQSPQGRGLASYLTYKHLVEAGVRYVEQPKKANDWVQHLYFLLNWVPYNQFPAEVFYHGGECRGLSTLYSAIIYRMGIKTGIVREPLHVFSLVHIGGKADHVRVGIKSYPLVTIDGQKFLAVDVSEIGKKLSVKVPFSKALRTQNTVWYGKSKPSRYTRIDYTNKRVTRAMRSTRFPTYTWLGRSIVVRNLVRTTR